MRYVVDANIIISGLIADSMTRTLLVNLDHNLLTPAYVYAEVDKYSEMVAEKSGLSPAAVEDLVELLFKRIDVVPRSEVLSGLQQAARVMHEIDPDDSIYLATAVERDAGVWSDDRDFQEQELVPVATTGEMVDQFR